MGAYENVFGEGVQFDDNGDPIETGIGAVAHPDQVALRERLARQAPAQEAVASQPAPVGATTAATPVEAAATASAEPEPEVAPAATETVNEL